MSSYFQPIITVDADNAIDHSQMVGIVPTLLVPANPDRGGIMIQSLSETNDFWFGYDNGVTIGAAGYFCLRANGEGSKKPWFFPANGVWRGPIYGLVDGGGDVTIIEWNVE